MGKTKKELEKDFQDASVATRDLLKIVAAETEDGKENADKREWTADEQVAYDKATADETAAYRELDILQKTAENRAMAAAVTGMVTEEEVTEEQRETAEEHELRFWGALKRGDTMEMRSIINGD